MEPAKKIPAFFQPFIAEDRAQRMIIPMAFKVYMEGKVPFSALLRDRNGNVWNVDVSQIGDRFFFIGGWPKFVEKINIEFGDFLVFQYDGKYCFSFKLLGRTASEKNVGVSGIIVKEEEEDVEEDEEEEEEEDEEEENGVDAASDYDDEDYMEDDEEDEDDGDGDAEGADTEEIVELRDFKKRERKTKGESSSAGRGSYGKRKMDDIDEENTVFEALQVDQPKNAYFVAKVKSNRPSDMYVPLDVIRDFDLKLPEKMIIQDEHGRKWTTRVNVWKDGRTRLTNGWKAFCKWNKVLEDDRCLCEFVPGNSTGGGNDIFLQVRILRA